MNKLWKNKWLGLMFIILILLVVQSSYELYKRVGIHYDIVDHYKSASSYRYDNVTNTYILIACDTIDITFKYNKDTIIFQGSLNIGFKPLGYLPVTDVLVAKGTGSTKLSLKRIFIESTKEEILYTYDGEFFVLFSSSKQCAQIQ